MSGPCLIVPLDGSLHAAAALPIAQEMARLYGGTLAVIHASEPALPAAAAAAATGLAAARFAGVVVEGVAGSPAQAIVRSAGEHAAALIVMCPHTTVVPPDRRIGRTAAEVLRRAPCPVLLVKPLRPPAPWTPRTILVPLDGTPASAAAIHPASEIAARAGAGLLVLHVTGARRDRPGEPGTLGAPRYTDQPQHEWTAWAAEFRERACQLCEVAAGVSVRLFLAAGDPGGEIVQFALAHQVDLIALAWRGTLEDVRAATVKTVVREAPCPVLLVRF